MKVWVTLPLEHHQVWDELADGVAVAIRDDVRVARTGTRWSCRWR